MKIHSDSTLRALNKYVLFKLVREREEMWIKLKEWLSEQNFDEIDTLMVLDKMHELEDDDR